MKIFGTRLIATKIEKGSFHCPFCCSVQDYERIDDNRFLTILKIPLFPLGKEQEYVLCLKCKDSFDVGVVSIPSEKSFDMEAEYNNAVKNVMIHVLLADGNVLDSEIDKCRDIYSRVTQREIDPSEILTEVERIRLENENIDSVGRLRGVLNEKGIDYVLRAAYLVAISDGEFHEKEKELIFKIGEFLGMERTKVNNIIEETQNH